MFESFMKNFVQKNTKDKHSKSESEEQVFPDPIKESPKHDAQEDAAQEEMRLAKMRSQDMFKQGRKNIEANIYQATAKEKILPTYDEHKAGITVASKLEDAISNLLEEQTPKVKDPEFATARAAYIDLLKKDVVDPLIQRQSGQDRIAGLDGQVMYGGFEATLEQAEQMEKLKREMQELSSTFGEYIKKNINPVEIRARGIAGEMGLAILQEQVYRSLAKLLEQSTQINTKNEKNFRKQFDGIKTIFESLKQNNASNNFGGEGKIFFSAQSRQEPSFNQIAEILGQDVSRFDSRPLVRQLAQAAGDRPQYYVLPENLKSDGGRYEGVEVQFIIDAKSGDSTTETGGLMYYYKVIDNRSKGV